MSRIVQEYIRNYTTLKSTSRFGSRLHDSLLSLERCVADLYKKRQISELELTILKKIIEGYNYSEIAKELEVDRLRVSLIFKTTCKRISYVLGEDFSDDFLIEGYL